MNIPNKNYDLVTLQTAVIEYNDSLKEITGYVKCELCLDPLLVRVYWRGAQFHEAMYCVDPYLPVIGENYDIEDEGNIAIEVTWL